MIRAAVAALALASKAAVAAEFTFEDKVLVLNQDNFDEAIAKYNPLLVEFYAPWCGHCKTLAPQYAKAAAQLELLDPPQYVAKVDATKEGELAKRFGIRGYPSLKFFRDGEPTDYKGGRTTGDIVSFVRKATGPAWVAVPSGAALDKFKAANKITVLGYFAAGDEAVLPLRRAFEAAAANVDGVGFGVVEDEQVAAAAGLSNGAIVLARSGEEETFEYTGSADAAAVTTFVRENELPLVIDFSPETSGKLFEQPITTHFLLLADSRASSYKPLRAAFEEAARANKGEALFVHVGADQGNVLRFFGVEASQLPTAVIATFPKGGQQRKYLFPGGDLSAAAFQAFLDDYQGGKLVPKLKSEEPPASNDEPVKVVVGKSFSSIALDESKDVLLEFYAPWCGHCKSLAPKYEQLAKSLAGVPSVVIAKMDATGNEVDFPGVSVQGFPTLYFFPAGTKKAIRFDGDRTEEGMMSFIQKHATHKFELPTGAASADGKDEL